MRTYEKQVIKAGVITVVMTLFLLVILPGTLVGIWSLGERFFGGNPGFAGCLHCAQIFHGAENRIREHDHTGSAAKGRIVGTFVFILGIVPDIDTADVQNPGLIGSSHDAVFRYRTEHLRKQRQNVDSHSSTSPSIRRTIMIRLFRFTV